MSLSRYKVAAAVAVSNMDRAREFYEGKLGLSPATDHEPDDNRPQGDVHASPGLRARQPPVHLVLLGSIDE